MPRLKVSSSEESSRVVRACINGNMALYNVSEDQMAVRWGLQSVRCKIGAKIPETIRWKNCGRSPKP